MTTQPEDTKDETQAGKKPYATPKLERLGDIENLTRLSPVIPGTDTTIVLGTH